MMTFDQIMEEMEKLSALRERTAEQEQRLLWLAEQLVLVTAA
jgi:hypothetical protein